MAERRRPPALDAVRRRHDLDVLRPHARRNRRAGVVRRSAPDRRDDEPGLDPRHGPPAPAGAVGGRRGPHGGGPRPPGRLGHGSAGPHHRRPAHRGERPDDPLPVRPGRGHLLPAAVVDPAGHGGRAPRPVEPGRGERHAAPRPRRRRQSARRPGARCGGSPGHRHPIRLRGRRRRAGGLAGAAPPEPATPPPGRRHRGGDRPHDRGDGGLPSRLLRRPGPQHVLPEARRLRPRGPAGPGSRGHRGHRRRLPGRPAGRRRPGSAPARARRPGRRPPAGAAGRAQRPLRRIRRRGRVGVLPDPEPVPHAEPRPPAGPRRGRAPSGSGDRRRSRPASGGASPGSWCWPPAVRPWST